MSPAAPPGSSRPLMAACRLTAFVPPFAKGSVPLTSAVKLTALKDGAPAPPCRTVVAVPVEPRAAIPCPPWPMSNWLEVRADADVAQVAQVKAPVVALNESGPDALTANVPDAFGSVSVALPATACD